MSTVLIVDGNPLAWRGSVMYQNLTNTMGTPTGCIYSALTNFVHGVKATKPDAAVVVWDCGKSRWRRELHPGYKLRRDSADKTPEEKAKRASVLQQIVLAQKIFAEAGVHQISVEGVEADDILGILASGFDCLDTYDRVVILGGDKDLWQLVRGVVCLYEPVNRTWVGEDHVKLKTHGVGPEQIVELKALTGDSGDDVLGVPGVGTKRAAGLLLKYGSIEAAFDAENEKAMQRYKWSRAVLESKDIIDKARKLVTIPNCIHMEQLSDEERRALAREIWKVPTGDRLSLSGSLDFYEMGRVLENLDVLCQPGPNFEGFEEWLPRNI